VDHLPTTPAPPGNVQIACAAHGDFERWLARLDGCLAVTTYQAGKVAFIGWDGRGMTLLMRHFDKPLGLAVDGRRMALATRHELLLLANAPALAHDYLEDQPGRYDALYLPRVSYHTGDLHVHDVVYDRQGLLCVNTRYSCLMRPSADYSFEPVWRPPFVSDYVPEDRCHLNGVALRDGEVRYATALGATDTAGGWRAAKATGGVLLEVPSGETILGGLSMPHTPRWHDGRLWLLNSGAGELLVLDDRGRPTVVCRLPGYLRGLCFVGRYAAVGMCKIRERHIFGGLPIQEQTPQLVCGVALVDTLSGQHMGTFQFTAGCEELYDVQFVAGVRRPMVLSLDKPAVLHALTDPISSFWLRPSAELHESAAPHLAEALAPDPTAAFGAAGAASAAAPSASPTGTSD
jgi:uncharacterized protein (TIGR03032 family)